MKSDGSGPYKSGTKEHRHISKDIAKKVQIAFGATTAELGKDKKLSIWPRWNRRIKYSLPTAKFLERIGGFGVVAGDEVSVALVENFLNFLLGNHGFGQFFLVNLDHFLF